MRRLLPTWLRAGLGRLLPAGIRAVWLDPDRPLLTHGPVVRLIVVTSSLGTIVAAVALIIALTQFSGQLDRNTERTDINTALISAIQGSRKGNVGEICGALSGLIRAAAQEQEVLQPRRAASIRKQTTRFLKKTDLLDCRKYVRDHVKLHVRPKPPPR